MPAHSCKRFWNSKNRESVLNTEGKLEFHARFAPGSSEKRSEVSRDANRSQMGGRRGCTVISFEGIDEESWRSISFPCFFENRSKENFIEKSVDILEGGIFKENLRKFRVASSGSRSLD